MYISLKIFIYKIFMMIIIKITITIIMFGLLRNGRPGAVFFSHTRRKVNKREIHTKLFEVFHTGSWFAMEDHVTSRKKGQRVELFEH